MERSGLKIKKVLIFSKKSRNRIFLKNSCILGGNFQSWKKILKDPI